MIINQESCGVSQATNEYFRKYYVGRKHRNSVFTNHHGRITLKMLVDHDWGAGIPRAQTEIDAMHYGYSLCVVVPYITQRWAHWDREYAEYQRQCEQDLDQSIGPIEFPL
jgi:hypothetical protein